MSWKYLAGLLSSMLLFWIVVMAGCVVLEIFLEWILR